jgi:hypothetical protein
MDELLDFIKKNGFEIVSVTLKLKHADCPKTMVAQLKPKEPPT